MFLIISGITNAVLNLILVIWFRLDVAGVAIATIIAQMISCILVLRCLYKSESSYQLRFSRLTIKVEVPEADLSGRYSGRTSEHGY